jgi:hypothetical protein
MLEIPGWVPPSVAAIAREMHGSLKFVPELKSYADAIERLACDSRMRPVWNELEKRHRSGSKTGSYMYSAKAESIRADPMFANASAATASLLRGDKVQNQAFVILFVRLANLRSWNERGRIGPRARAVKEANREINSLLSVVRRIRTEAERLHALGIGHFPTLLEEVATQVRAIAVSKQMLNSEDDLIIARNRSRVRGEWDRGFIISAANIFEYLFGQKMHGLVAILTNVSLGRSDIKESLVKGMLRARRRTAHRRGPLPRSRSAPR